MPTYARADVVFERGEGPYLFDTNGKRYLDFASGVAVTALAMPIRYLIKALTDQAHKVWHTSNICSESRVRSVWGDDWSTTPSPTRCSSPIPASRHGNARSRWCGNTSTRRGIPSAGGSSPPAAPSTGARSRPSPPTKQEKMVKGFGPMSDGFDQVAFGNMNELRAAITNETAGISIEPVQGEGGIRAGFARLPARAAPGLRRVRPAAALRRDPDRHGPHRQAVRP